MPDPINWQATAFNQSTDSSNQIHSDEIARAYGFRGGLVPGVTVSSYLIHPAVEAWGADWLSRGSASIVVRKPLYDGFKFEVELTEVTAKSYRATLTDQEGTQCAVGHIQLKDALPAPPKKRGDAMLTEAMGRGEDIPAATREEMDRLKVKGMFALPARWNVEDTTHNKMVTYLKDVSAMPAIHSFDGKGYANAAYMLGLTNWVLAGNAYMNPWIHLQTDSQFYAIVKNDANLIVECNITDLYEKKGHEFVDLKVDVYQDDSMVMSANLRAIYRLRGI